MAIITPILLSKSAFGAYFLFGFLALGTVAVLAACMPETRGQSLESIQEAFQRPVMSSWIHHLKRFVSSDTTRNTSVSSGESIELSNILAEGPISSSSSEARRGLRLELGST